jgi:hypothetical protein
MEKNSFFHLGLFPFCFLSDKEEEEINIEVAERDEDYSGSYAGTLFPIRCELDQAMALFWRIKKIKLTAKLSDIRITETESSRTEVYDIAEIKSGSEFITTNIETEDPLESLRLRVCGPPYQLDSEFESTSGSIFTNLETGEIIDRKKTETEGISVEWFAASPYEGRRGISKLNFGGNKENSRDYIYMPYLQFVFSRYNDFWTTYFPHFDRTDPRKGLRTYTRTGDTKNISINIPELGSVNMTFYQIITNRQRSIDPPLSADSGGGDATFSNWDVELWEKAEE